MQRLAGALLILGSIIFLIAAFFPLTYQVVLATPQDRAILIEQNQTGWLIVNLLFGAGSILTVIGLGLFVQHLQALEIDSRLKLLGYGCLALFALGTIFWLMICYYRVSVPAQSLTSNLAANSWIFPAYTVLIQITLMLVGILLLRSGYPAWAGGAMLGLAAASLVAFLIFKDMPPLAHYVLLLAMGVGLLR